MDPVNAFKEETKSRVEAQGKNNLLGDLSKKFINESFRTKYSYNFSWLGRPIIQYPQDVMAMQELIWSIKPDLIIETGIAHGGSLIFYASMLELIGSGTIVGVDIEIKPHNRAEIESHPMFKRIKLIEGSSTSAEIVAQVEKIAKGKKNVMVLLDSNHTHEHVLKEIQLYEKFVTVDSYLVVFDTLVEDLDEDLSNDRPWGKGDNPLTAVREFLKLNDSFEIDSSIDNKILISVAPSGYLKRVK